MFGHMAFMCNRQCMILMGSLVGLGLCVWFLVAYPPTVLNRTRELKGLNANFTQDKLKKPT